MTPPNPDVNVADRLRRYGIPLAWLALLLWVAYAFLRVNWYPIVAPDSLDYLDHSNDLLGTGLIQNGFRQFGYPAWLAIVDSTAQRLGLPPLTVTVVAQRALLLIPVVSSIFVLRWWSIPSVLILTVPTAVVYSNLILTEAVTFPVAAMAGVSCVALYRCSKDRTWSAWLVVAVATAVLLPMVRLHFGVVTVAVCFAILGSRWTVAHLRRRALFAVGGVAIVIVILAGAFAVENHAEKGFFSPSLGSERSLYWMTWETLVPDHEGIIEDELPDIYGNGRADTFLFDIDHSGLSYAQQREAFAEAVDLMYEATGASFFSSRVSSLVGALTGARLDDIKGAVLYAATPVAGESVRVIHQYSAVTPVDPEWIATKYNAGFTPTVFFSVGKDLPDIRQPYVGLLAMILIPYAAVLCLYLLGDKRSRLLAITGLIAILGYGAASFVFIFDNFRWLLPAYAFSIVIVSGAAMAKWGPPTDFSNDQPGSSSATTSTPLS